VIRGRGGVGTNQTFQQTISLYIRRPPVASKIGVFYFYRRRLFVNDSIFLDKILQNYVQAFPCLTSL